MTGADIQRGRVLAAREQVVTAGGRKFTIRRVGQLAFLRLQEKHRGDGAAFVDALVLQSVVGWEMTEADLYAGGGDSPVEFDPVLFATWLDDEVQTHSDLAEAVLEQLQRARDLRVQSAKN